MRTALSRQIVNHAIDWIERNRANAVLLYLSMRSEVETGNLLDYLLAQNKIVLAPVMDTKQRSLAPHRITDGKKISFSILTVCISRTGKLALFFL